MAKKRASLIVEGNVQRVGFRDFAVENALEFNLVGRAKNLEDGKVEIICEGEEKNLKKFIKEINVKSYPINVRRISSKFTSPINEFNSFEVIRGKTEEEMSERADEAAKYMRLSFGKMNSMDNKLDSMNSKLGKLDSMNSKLGSMDGKLDSVDGKLGKLGSINGKLDSLNKKMGSIDKKTGLVYGETKGLRNETKSNFNLMNQKYGSISKEMRDFKNVMMDLRKTLKKDREGMDLLTKTMIRGINALAKGK